MTEPGAETQQCPNCGTPNEIGLALCRNCKTPLTAYAGDLSGTNDSDQGALAQQVAQMHGRPPVVIAAIAYFVLFAVFWPLATILHQFAARPRVAPNDMNYISAAVGAVGPVLYAFALVPVIIAFIALAVVTWMEQHWTWSADAMALVVCSLLALRTVPTLRGDLFLAGGVVILCLWLKPRTRAWFGHF